MSGGIVYSITHGGMTYYGSTKRPNKDRWNKHKSDYKNDRLNGGSLIIFLRAELDNELPTYTVLEKYENIDIGDLKRREQYYIDNFECVNILNAISTEEQIAEQQKGYKARNREHIAEQQKGYKARNREKILEQKKTYREKIKQAKSTSSP